MCCKIFHNKETSLEKENGIVFGDLGSYKNKEDSTKLSQTILLSFVTSKMMSCQSKSNGS